MTRLTVTIATLLLLAGCSDYISEPPGSKYRFMAYLSGANEVPPSASAGKGYMEAQYAPATRILKWVLNYSDLGGPVTWAHLHGPDGVGNDDAAIVPINMQIEGSGHPGGATLTQRQAEDLIAGRWYVNLKTAQYPAGEVRGPLVLKTEPAKQ